MANTVQKLIDTNKRIVVKIVGSVDNVVAGGQETNVIKIDVSSLSQALNANNLVMSANTHPKSIYRVNVKKIVFSVGSAAGYVKVFYDNSAGLDGTIAYLRGTGSVDQEGILFSNPNAAPNSNGDICVSTIGFTSNDVYTLIIEGRKEDADYYQGDVY